MVNQAAGFRSAPGKRDIFRPSGFSSPNNLRAYAALRMIDRSAGRRSSSVKARPRTIGIPSVRK